MSKTKIWGAALIAVLMLASVAGTAYAASADNAPSLHPGGPGNGKRVGRGQAEVTSVGTDEFTVVRGNGNEITISVDDDTRYFGDLDSFNDIEVGMTVAIIGVGKGDGEGLAKAVGAGEFPLGQGARGEVTAVGADSLTIENRDGESLTFQVDGETLFLSRNDDVNSLSDIAVGDHAGVHYEEASDGSLIAKTIGAGTPSGDGPPADRGNGNNS